MNKDQRLDINEFRNLLAQNLGAGATLYAGNIVSGGPYAGGAYESSSSSAFEGAGGVASGFGNITGLAAAAADGIGSEGGNENFAYDLSSFSSGTAGASGGFDVNVATADGSAAVGTGVAVTGGTASSSTFEANTTQQQIQQYATDKQGLFQDPNPQIIRRPAQGGQVTYTQNIKIRFLRPPPAPEPGVSTHIKQVQSEFLINFSHLLYKKSDHLNHHHHHHWLFVNVLQHIQHHLLLFYVNDHHLYQLHFPLKQVKQKTIKNN